MHALTRRLLAPVLGLAALGAAALAPLPASASEDPVYKTLFGTAIDGTDPVAYFTESRPVEGSSDYTHDWNGATWRFSSAENRDLFAANPEKYAPQYGGYCAWAVSQGYTASTDPDAWAIVDGKLYLNYNQSVQTRWEKDVPGHIASANGNWPRVLE
ncbi:MAG: YHS domain-containing (seleno)protein [Pseudomonadota bacterium]